MKQYIKLLFFFIIISDSIIAQEIPILWGKVEPTIVPVENESCYEQMANPGTNSITSQNFETVFDSFDTKAADDFFIPAGQEWILSSVSVLGNYYNGTGPATSVNVWFYNDSSGHPGTTADSVMNIVPSGGLETGSFEIPFAIHITLPEGTYWLSVQCNMDFAAGGQWGWTEQLQSNLESNWQNPGGGFGTPCTSWGYRVTTCGVGGTTGYPDFSFRLNCVTLPVELTAFRADVIEDIVELSWITATETNNRGFEVQRSSGEGDFESITFIEGQGTTTEVHAYSYSDKNLKNGSYSYRLMQIDYDGSFEYSTVVEVGVTVSAVYSLAQNYPNPFNPSTMIKFSLPVDSRVRIELFNTLGEKVDELTNRDFSIGNHEINFDASKLSNGVYYYTINASGIDGSSFASTKKMVLMK